MLTYVLQASAVLKNVTGVQPVDTQEYPFDYKFRIKCIGCKRVHDNPVEMNRFDRFEVTGFRREANFLIKCRDCKRERYATLKRSKEKICEDEHQTPILRIITHGIELLEFIPDDQFECQSKLSNRVIQEIDLSNGEWYDFDDEGNGDVGIDAVKWELTLTR
ncbi:uncharacterized protein RJT20DRAFT_38063 [Scheffersomyces xylosifermentans]|uniref:uncharacterized protein n=1 Tax=Scheffersomyces xylosifermentans TaxID=1304137 RepID=UPI00315D83D1